VFLNGHEAFDFERGLAPEVEGQPGNRLSGRPPLRREADYLLRRMRALKEFGTDLPNAVRVDQFYTMGSAVSAYHLARFAEFGSYIPPSTSIIMERCFTARTNTHTSMIAVIPGQGYDVDKFTLPGQAISASGYNPAVAANDFVFVAGNMAFRPDGTQDPKVYVGPGRNWGGETAFRRQVHYVITDRLEPSLKAAGSALVHSLKAQAYIREPSRFHRRVVAAFPRHSLRRHAGAGEGLRQYRKHDRDQPHRAQGRCQPAQTGGRDRHTGGGDLRALRAGGRTRIPVGADPSRGGRPCARRRPGRRI
jgi:enamine deaminase RidA (YjgF/YER057c/UK114 family)